MQLNISEPLNNTVELTFHIYNGSITWSSVPTGEIYTTPLMTCVDVQVSLPVTNSYSKNLYTGHVNKAIDRLIGVITTELMTC